MFRLIRFQAFETRLASNMDIENETEIVTPCTSRLRGDAGMSTAEYAVGTLAAIAFAVVLYKIVQSPEVHQALAHIITSALNVSL